MAKPHHTVSVTTLTHQVAGAHSTFVLRKSTHAVKAALLMGLSLGGLALSSVPAMAKTIEQGTQARHKFSVSAGPLAQVLAEFARAAGVDLKPDVALLQGKTSPGLSGSYSVEEGFAELLRGQGLQANRAVNGSFSLSSLTIENSSEVTKGEVSLPIVSVKAKAVSASDPYAGGQVAYRSRVGMLGDKDFMETPFGVISYTDKFIEDRQARDITDVIAAADPTVFSNGLTGTYSENYSIRGLSSSSNDVSVNGLFGVAPFYRTSPEMFERIEVLKGPSALLNGMPPSGSVAGTVNLVPKRAGDDPLTRLTLGFSSASQLGGHLDVGRRFGEDKQFGVRVNGAYRNGKGAIEGQERMNQMASLGLDWRTATTRVSADLYASEDRVDGLTRGINLAPGLAIPRPPSSDTLLNPDWSFVDTHDKGGMLRAEVDFSRHLTSYVALGSSKTDYKQNGAMSATVLNAQGDLQTRIAQLSFKLEKVSADIGLKGRLKTGDIEHQWGVNMTHYEHSNKDFGRRLTETWTTNIYQPVWGTAPAFSTSPLGHTELRLRSFGLVDTLSTAHNKVQLTVGLRRQQVISDSFNVMSGARTARYDQSATSPAAALLVKATDHLSIYSNYVEGLSQGATAPMDAANAGEVFPPYKSVQKEVGLKLDLGEFVHTLGVYEIKRPSSYTDPVSNVFSFGGEQRNRGIEWGFFGSAAKALRLMGGVAYVDPKLTKTRAGVNQGKTATGLPKLQAKLGLEWDVPQLQGLTVTANANAASRQYINADNSLSIPGRTLFDVGARLSSVMLGRPLIWRASVSNVSNKAYWGMPMLSSLGLGAPRTVSLSASTDF